MAASSSTHQLIDVKEIRENVAVLKNGGLRIIVMVSSINFALKSETEQEATIARFQDFINALDYTVEIVVQSRQLDISEYLNFLNERAGQEQNELLKIQTAEYINFIQELVKLSNVMSKFFYVVVALNVIQAAEAAGGLLAKIWPRKKVPSASRVEDLDFENKKNQLLQRVEEVIGLLGSMGLKAMPLGREELIELLYTNYNPGTVLKQKNLEQLIATGDEAKKPG